jgi:hypothetical protein
VLFAVGVALAFGTAGFMIRSIAHEVGAAFEPVGRAFAGVIGEVIHGVVEVGREIEQSRSK